MIRIGICDDSPDARCALRGQLEQILENRGVTASIFEFSSGEGILKWMEHHTGELDLVFLDIEMGEINGMDTAKSLRRLDSKLLLVFVTGYADYVFDGYSVGALGYLLKPTTAAQLDPLFGRALEQLYLDVEDVFICKSSGGMYRIPRQSILYFVSDRRKVRCVTQRQTYEFYGKLDDIAQQMGTRFIRIHQRYLVRAGAVDRLDGNEVFIGEDAFPVSRAYREDVMAALARASLEE